MSKTIIVGLAAALLFLGGCQSREDRYFGQLSQELKRGYSR